MNFEEITLRVEVSSRGGGIEIDLTSFGYPSQKMTAYQNYLGGGLLGAIGNSCIIRNWCEDDKLVKIAHELAEYFHSLTNHEGIEWEETTFDENQKRPMSAY